MAGQSGSCSRRWVGIVGALAVVAGIGLVLVGMRPEPAGAAPAALLPAAVLKDRDSLLVTIGLTNPESLKLRGTLTVELAGQDGATLASQSQQVTQTDQAAAYRFNLKMPSTPLDQLTLHFQYGKEEKFTVPLSEILVSKPHETTLSASREIHAGSTASLRCGVHGVKSLTETIPLAGADVEIRLRSADGKEANLYKGKAGKDGSANVQFAVPDLPAGQYTLVVATRSELGEEKLEQPIRVKREAKVLLTTDKPLYQPNQLMHIRALALRPFDLAPEANRDLTFEVEDAKGNKVFKKTLKTSEYGIAAVDFQLADEVNMGDYQIRASFGEEQAQKTVAVKKYVLPKFKVEVKSDKKFYQPGETAKIDVQAGYFFGKPVGAGKVKLIASAFDVQFAKFAELNGTADAQGHVHFDLPLPKNFVGQPLQKGDALVKLEVKLTDSADHSETVTKTYPVSDQAIRVSLIPEAGRLTPGMENRIFAAAIYPDGSPAKCDVQIWMGKKPANGAPLASLKTNDAGLAEFKLTPKPEQFHSGEWKERQIEMLGGQTFPVGGQQLLFDLTAQAKDVRGAQATATVALNADPLGDNVLLRLDKAIYKAGDTIQAEVRSSAGLPTAYIEIVRGGQTMLTKWLDVKDGKATHLLDLPAGIFGTLEIHAYQMLASGEIVRDGRVVYVQPRDDLKIAVKADQEVYQPGKKGEIRFQVTDAAGKPTPAALGVIIVDEAVYALQDMQPGLEKVYFTLQEELLKPQAQVIFKPAESFDLLVRESEVPASKQQIAQALLANVRPKPPARWEVEPALARQQQAAAQVQQIGFALFNHGANNRPVVEVDATTKRLKFAPNLLKDMLQAGQINAESLLDPFGGKLSLDELAQIEKGFTAERLAQALNSNRMQQVMNALVNYTGVNQGKYFKNNQWIFTETVLAEALKSQGMDATWASDTWGTPFKLVKRAKPAQNMPWDQAREWDLASAGPDKQFGTADDLSLGQPNDWNFISYWWLADPSKAEVRGQQLGGIQRRIFMLQNGAMRFGGIPGGGGFGGVADMAMPAAAPAPGGFAPQAEMAQMRGALKEDGAPPMAPGQGGAPPAGGAAPPKVREYFPETLLWRPALITDDKGVAVLPVEFADSITTWRLSASANTRGGALGGVSAPLRVFQDFFVDLDLPVALTQNDEVAFPVAVYNYLKTPQTVKIELEAANWFELMPGETPERSLDLKPNEVTAVKFRIRAQKVGYQPLTVKAIGSKLSDAIKRSVEVVPYGQKVEQVAADRLQGSVKHVIDIPADAVPDASKLLVKIYPGVLSQVLEGTEGMLRMPGGCFEQTSSSAYPNILVVDYLKKAKLANPQILMKSEAYLNTGYQKLLTFERPGGGFDWWGSGEPLVWLSAYGLQQFNDMAKVWPIDRGIIDRTQAFLIRNQNADGTWDKIGATHGESIERMGDAKLLLTSYVVWSLQDSGMKVEQLPQLQNAIDYIRAHAKDAKDNPYVLALVANALAAHDAKDDRTFEVLKRLEALKVAKPDWKAVHFPGPGTSLAYSRGDGVDVETTALAVLAMVRSGQFNNTVNQALTYLVKAKGGDGAWGSTQATILALKALIAGASGPQQDGTAEFTILVNGKEAAKGAITPENADVMQLFDLKDATQVGANEVEIKVNGKTNLMYQVVGRHFAPWKPEAAVKPVIEVAVDYDRTELAAGDLLKAKATLKYHGDVPTYMVIVDLGIPPGFNVEAGDFAELVGAKKVEKFTITPRQVTLYLGDVKPGDVKTFDYTLKPKYPIKAKTPATVAYEYNTPKNRATTQPVELTVGDKK